MSTIEARPPVAPGELAPDFALTTLAGEGTVSLADYRGRSPLFLAIFIGLWCPFCRRSIAQMGVTEGKLRALGVESLGIVATAPENARLYFRYRPTPLRLAVDPACATHRAYGLPKAPMTPQTMEMLQTTKVNPTGELPHPLPVPEASEALDRLHNFKPSDTDHREFDAQMGQLKGQFLIDRDGIVRWTNIECASEGLAGLGKFPSEEELLAAVRMLPGSDPA